MVVSLNGLPNLETTPLQAAINLTMLQRFLRIPSVDNSYWTLSYELLFYLAIFIAFLTGALRRPTLVCAFFMTYQLTIITAYRYGVHFPEAFVKSTGVPYGHQFATGIAFYCLATGEQRRLSPHVIILAAIAIDLILPDDLSGPVENNGYVFAVFCALFYLFVFGRLRFIINRPLVYLGAISYSLYLVHQHFGFVVIRACKELGFHTIPAVCSAMIASFLVAIAIHHIVEVPVMHSIRKWYRVRWDLLGILRTT